MYCLSPRARFSRHVHSVQQSNRAELLAGYALVLECVHPANLGVLPPSPKVLFSKMLLLGLEPKQYHI